MLQAMQLGQSYIGGQPIQLDPYSMDALINNFLNAFRKMNSPNISMPVSPGNRIANTSSPSPNLKQDSFINSTNYNYNKNVTNQTQNLLI